MSENIPNRCQHKTRTHVSHNIHETHTYQCKLDENHGVMHEADGPVGHKIIWYREGPPPEIDYSTRFLFGRSLEMSK